MLWVIIKGASHQIIGCNIHQEGGKHQLWVERSNGKNLKIMESEDLSEVQLHKDAIDYAIETREPTLRLS